MIPSSAHECTVVEVPPLPLEHVEYVSAYLEGNADGDEYWKGADESRPVVLLRVSPIVVVPVDAIRVNWKASIE